MAVLFAWSVPAPSYSVHSQALLFVLLVHLSFSYLRYALVFILAAVRLEILDEVPFLLFVAATG